MKDFIFSDPSESNSIVVFRTDAISNSTNNFTIHQITGLENVQSYQRKKRALLAFGKRETTKQALIAFATTYQLDLVERDSNGANATILVDWNSDSSAASW